MDPCIQTRFGNVVNLVDPDPSTIDLADITYALSNISRFTGHASPPYTVAAHSLIVLQLVRQCLTLPDPVVEMWALMHDAAEAYIGDISSPLKELLLIHSDDGWSASRSLKTQEERILRVIQKGLNLPPLPLPKAVSQADRVALAIEMPVLMPGPLTDSVVQAAADSWPVGCSLTWIQEAILDLAARSPQDVRNRFHAAYCDLHNNLALTEPAVSVQ